MSASPATEPGAATPTKSRRSDWILLPALALVTIGVLCGVTELLARHFFPVEQVGFQNCFATDDPTGDAPVKPNSVCWERMAESPYQAEYRFNSRGDRAGTELTPKAPGVYRIVLIGSSLTQGLFIPREKTFAGLLPGQLSAKTGRTIEVYNEARGGKFRGGSFPTRNSAQHFGEVLAAQPDMILWVLTPTDVINAMAKDVVPQTPAPAAPAPANKFQRLLAKANIADRFKNRWEQTRTSIAIKHLLLQHESKEEYVESYLKNEDESGFLKVDPGPMWQKRLANFHAEIAEIEQLAKAAGIPLVAVYVPNRAQTAMISKGDWSADYDPFQLDNELHQSIQADGETFVDILPDYRTIPAPERHYFPIDGHPDADGQAIIANFLSTKLAEALPALKAPASSQIATEPQK